MQPRCRSSSVWSRRPRLSRRPLRSASAPSTSTRSGSTAATSRTSRCSGNFRSAVTSRRARSRRDGSRPGAHAASTGTPIWVTVHAGDPQLKLGPDDAPSSSGRGSGCLLPGCTTFYVEHCGPLQRRSGSRPDEAAFLVAWNLHDRVNSFTQSWQRHIRETQKRTRPRWTSCTSRDLAPRTTPGSRRSAAWLKDRPERTTMLAFLQAEGIRRSSKCYVDAEDVKPQRHPGSRWRAPSQGSPTLHGTRAWEDGSGDPAPSIARRTVVARFQSILLPPS